MALPLQARGFKLKNFIPSRVDHRDYGLPVNLLTGNPTGSRIVLLDPPSGVAALGPVKSQGQQGSCDGNSEASMGERLYRFAKGVAPVFSAAYSYAKIRIFEGTFPQDDGGQIITGQIISDGNPEGEGTGYCLESVMPYNDQDYSTVPSDEAVESAKSYPGGAYHNIGNSIGNIKLCVASGYSFKIGIAVYQSFESDEAASSGLIPFPSSDENLLGYHALHTGMICDDTIQCPGSPNKGAVMFQNSWDVTWGIPCPLSSDPGGFAWISYDFLLNPNLTTDVRMSHLGLPWGMKKAA